MSVNGSASAQAAVLGTSEALPACTPMVRGYEFPARGEAPGAAPPAVDYERLLEAMSSTGFQGTAFGAAVAEVKRMLAWRLSDEPVPAGEEPDPERRKRTRCKARARACWTSGAPWCRLAAHSPCALLAVRRSSWLTPATWSPPACARASATWRSTGWCR